MKFKILSLVLIVLIAQTHFAQGSLTFGTVTVGTLLNNTVKGVLSIGATLLNNKLGPFQNVIADLSKGPLSNIPDDILSPVMNAIANLPAISQVVLQKLDNLISGVPEALVLLSATLKNITTINLPAIDLLREIQNIFSSTGSDIMGPIVNAIENEVEDFSNIIVPLTDGTTAALCDVVSATANATKILADILHNLETAVTGIPAAVGTAFKPLTNLLIGSSTTCASKVANQTLNVIADVIKNVTLCISTEYETLKNLFTQLEDLSPKLEEDKANGAAKASNVVDLLQLAGSISPIVSIAGFKIVICGSVQAGFLVSNIVTLVAAAISSTVTCIV